MESTQGKVEKVQTYTIHNVDWRYEMIEGRLIISFPGGQISIQIDHNLQIGHSPMNIKIEVPLYA